MIPTADDLLRDAEARFDRTIVELAVEEGNRLLAAGSSADDLPRLMAPFVDVVRQWRADAMARMQAHTRRIRLLEARIALNEALIARTEACLAYLERWTRRCTDGLEAAHVKDSTALRLAQGL
jgi:hypothetical protein